MLNKQSGNMYAWITHTWNPIKGYCPHECIYCYMKRFDVGELRLDQKEFKTGLKSDNFIFVGSGTDAFCEQVPGEWIDETLKHCTRFDNRYLFQTKSPGRFKEFMGKYPDKTVFGTTLETDRLPDGISKAPDIRSRARAMQDLADMGCKTMVTIEPVIDFNPDPFLELIKICKPEWVNIGADSKRHRLPEPDPDKIRLLIQGLNEFTRVHKKENLNRII